MTAIETLISVLCDPEGKCCISGSDDDRRLIESALAELAQAAQQAPAGVTLRSMIEGMSVSVDVSTGDHDAGHRYFGTVTEVMECQGDKHGVTLLVQDAEPNFTATPTAPSTPSSTAQQASAHVLHLVQDAFAEVAMAYPKAFALHKVGLADTAVRKALALLAKWGQPAVKGEPVAWLSPWRKDQVTTDYDAYGKQGIPLYAAPQPVAREPLTDEQIKALMQAHRTAMLMTCKAQVPECGEFAAIAQDLDWLCESFGIKGGQHVE